MKDSEKLYPGIYEQILSKKLKEEVDSLKQLKKSLACIDKLDKAEASSVLSNYMAYMINKCLDIVADTATKKDDNGSDDYKIHSQIDFINDLIRKINSP